MKRRDEAPVKEPKGSLAAVDRGQPVCLGRQLAQLARLQLFYGVVQVLALGS
jgi:hypothetical protein